MAAILPIPPTGTPYIDPATGTVSLVWQNYLLSLENALAVNVAPIDAQYWTSTSNSELANERNIGALASGYLKITTAIGIATPSSVTTIPAADLTAGGTFPAINGSALTSLTAGNITAGGTFGAINGSALTSLNATNIASGSLADARLSTNVPLKNGTNAFSGLNSFPAGISSTTVVPSGRVSAITAAAPTSGTIEEILVTYTMGANTLNVNGQALRVSSGYTTAANGNNKTIKVRVGGIAGTVILTYTSATNAGSIWFDALLTRRTSATAYGNGFATDGATSAVTGAAATPTLTGSVDIVVTGTTPTAAGDMSVQQFIAEYLG